MCKDRCCDSANRKAPREAKTFSLAKSNGMYMNIKPCDSFAQQLELGTVNFIFQCENCGDFFFHPAVAA